jgi:hypothetical protein
MNASQVVPEIGCAEPIIANSDYQTPLKSDEPDRPLPEPFIDLGLNQSPNSYSTT